MIIDAFLRGFYRHDPAEDTRKAQALEAVKTAFEKAELRAALHRARSEAIMLRGKLEQCRLYLVAAAKGSSLQAKNDLRALDAVLRATADD